ncbi:MAG: hypothetical protein WB974_08385 [Acidobacteriaceae bacterium]
MDTNTLTWLLDADPAIRWQAMRDRPGTSPAAIAAERARVPREGLGAAILALQESDGSWRRPNAPAWLTTLFTLLLLRATGADPADPAVQSAVARAQANLRWSNHGGRWDLRRPDLGGNAFFDGEVEPCISGGVLALGGYFGHPSENLARRLLAQQLDDGGWNCEAPKSRRSSFHTTLCVLEGLLEYERAAGSPSEMLPQIAAARRRAEQYLLERSLFRRLSTGDLAHPEFLELAFPPRYHYDILRALDYFRAAGAPPDPRIGDALHILEIRRQADGRWLLDRAYDEALALPAGETVGDPSRWNTLRALRVLRWADKRRLEAAS